MPRTQVAVKIFVLSLSLLLLEKSTAVVICVAKCRKGVHDDFHGFVSTLFRLESALSKTFGIDNLKSLRIHEGIF